MTDLSSANSNKTTTNKFMHECVKILNNYQMTMMEEFSKIYNENIDTDNESVRAILNICTLKFTEKIGDLTADANKRLNAIYEEASK